MPPRQSRVRRAFRVLGFTRNPLCRRVDRLEGTFRIAATLFTLLLVVAAGLLFTVAQARFAAQAATRRAALIQVPVVLLADVPTLGDDTGEEITDAPLVLARWLDPKGTAHTGKVFPEYVARKGEATLVWMDRSYRPVRPPDGPDAVLAKALLSTVLAWLVATICLWLLYELSAFVLNRRRDKAWTKQWRHFEQRWRHSV